MRIGDDQEEGEEDEVQNPMPLGDREHSVEDGVDPPSLEATQSARDAVNKEQADEEQAEHTSKSPDFGSEP